MKAIPETGRCSICRGVYTHYGNNPSPIGRIKDRCCDVCNHMFVIPVRLAALEGIRQKNKLLAQLDDRGRELIKRIMEQHPELTTEEAIEHVREMGGL